MKPAISKTRIRLVAFLLGIAMSPAYAADSKGMPESGMSFKDYDGNKDGYLSQDEFKAKGKDDLSFRAADLNGDGRIEPDEFDKYAAKKAADQPKPGY